MKVSAGKAAASVQSPPAGVRGFLLYGPDSGLVTAYAKTLSHQIVPEGDDDPFNRVRLDPEDLKAEKSRVADELAATTLMGGQRVVVCKGFGEREREALITALDVAEGGENRLIVAAGELAGASKLRKAFETRDDCLAIPCYADESRSLSQVIRETLSAAGMEADRDAMAALSAALGADRSLSLRELEKLVLYPAPPGTITSEDVEAVIADAAPLAIDAYLYAITGGQIEAADATLQRLIDDGQAPIRLHNALTQHLAKFLTVLSAGGDIAGAAQALRPPLFWKVKDRFIAQAGRMRTARLMEAHKSAHQAGLDLRLSALPPDLVLSRLTLRLCHLFA